VTALLLNPAALPAVQARLSFPAGFTARCFAHPDTYLNKVVVGSQQGKLQLWNFKAAAMVHEFSGWCVTLLPAAACPAGAADGADGAAMLMVPLQAPRLASVQLLLMCCSIVPPPSQCYFHH
jgi:hypothetical protein